MNKKDTAFYLILLLVFVILLTSMLLRKAKGEDVYLFSYRLIYIDSGSMEPTLKKGHIYLEKKVYLPQLLQEGDIITYSMGGSRITHRIVEVTDSSVLCKGDALDMDDGYYVPFANIQSIVKGVKS